MAYEFRGTSVVDPAPPGTDRRWSSARMLAFIFGTTFLLVGIAGFIPGVTTPFEELDFIGTTSEAKIVEVFLVSVFHNVFELLFVSGIIAGAGGSWSLVYLMGSGTAYVGLTAYGFAIKNSNFNFRPIKTADNFLHMGLAIGLLGAGLISLAASRRREHATV